MKECNSVCWYDWRSDESTTSSQIKICLRRRRCPCGRACTCTLLSLVKKIGKIAWWIERKRQQQKQIVSEKSTDSIGEVWAVGAAVPTAAAAVAAASTAAVSVALPPAPSSTEAARQRWHDDCTMVCSRLMCGESPTTTGTWFRLFFETCTYVYATMNFGRVGWMDGWIDESVEVDGSIDGWIYGIYGIDRWIILWMIRIWKNSRLVAEASKTFVQIHFRIESRNESNRIESNRIEAWFCSTFFEGQCVLVHKCTCSTPICGVTSPTDPNNSNYRLGLLVSIVIAASTSDDGGWWLVSCDYTLSPPQPKNKIFFSLRRLNATENTTNATKATKNCRERETTKNKHHTRHTHTQSSGRATSRYSPALLLEAGNTMQLVFYCLGSMMMNFDRWCKKRPTQLYIYIYICLHYTTRACVCVCVCLCGRSLLDR